MLDLQEGPLWTAAGVDRDLGPVAGPTLDGCMQGSFPMDAGPEDLALALMAPEVLGTLDSDRHPPRGPGAGCT